MYKSTKTYGHNIGLSCCFRQWRAESHCSLLHGYAIAVRLEFEADELDARNWVVDFGGLKEVKAELQSFFDHKLLVAEDDPQKDFLCSLAGMGLADVVVIPAVGCEAFAKFIFDRVNLWLLHQDDVHGRVRLSSVEVREHGANSAIYGE
jgi:6-pyruvoyltetrahydropterin/6-carboxytetrahydropterin synthase